MNCQDATVKFGHQVSSEKTKPECSFSSSFSQKLIRLTRRTIFGYASFTFSLESAKHENGMWWAEENKKCNVVNERAHFHGITPSTCSLFDK